MSEAGQIGVVVIGRNEGDRLAASLASVRAAGLPLVYVDSGSSDGSVERARAIADAVIALDPARPFSAARGRNEGLAELVRRLPLARYVMFLDGDCLLDPGFPAAAAAALDAVPERAIVTGHLQERGREASVYSRLAAMEWRSPVGDLDNPGHLGGIMMARISVVLALGGFNESVIAGEDSELGVRVGLAGYRVTKIDAPMATHEADIRRFSQWWRRSVRAGHAIGQRYALNGRGPARDCVRDVRSTLFWGIALPLVILLLAVPTGGLSLILLFSYAVLGWRIFRSLLRSGASPGEALLGARFGLYGKFANGIGLLRYWWNRRRGAYRIIEYK